MTWAWSACQWRGCCVFRGCAQGAGDKPACTALAAFLVAAVPTLLAARAAFLQAQALMFTLEQELPDTAAALRLSGLEMSDCFEEVSLLSNDLTAGVRASAQLLTDTQQGIKGGVELVGATVVNTLLPAVRSRVLAEQGTLEASLQQRVRLKHTAPTLVEGIMWPGQNNP
ncbi:hypothetical protein WJX81_006236 [Elliptochloris bilobata]|uniref:Uncharacterized protein n=1 Tax=Elliptochloris bilobata TaxID=381761 RepID=A0AAW1QY85_9CHLO